MRATENYKLENQATRKPK